MGKDAAVVLPAVGADGREAVRKGCTESGWNAQSLRWLRVCIECVKLAVAESLHRMRKVCSGRESAWNTQSLQYQEVRVVRTPIPTSPRFRSVKNTAGAKFGNTSLSAGVLQGDSVRNAVRTALCS